MTTKQISLADETSNKDQAGVAKQNPGVPVIVRRLCYVTRQMIAWKNTYANGVLTMEKA